MRSRHTPVGQNEDISDDVAHGVLCGVVLELVILSAFVIERYKRSIKGGLDWG